MKKRDDNSIEINTVILPDKKSNADNNNKHHDAELFEAIRKDNFELLKNALDKGANPNLQEENGYSLLHIAAMKGNTRIIKLLLEQDKIKVDIKNDWESTPLPCAVVGGHLDAANILLEAGADPNAKGSDGFNALNFAAGIGNISILELLTKYGGDINTTAKGISLAHNAAIGIRNHNYDLQKVMKWLFSHGFNYELTTPEIGASVTDLLSMYNYYDAARYKELVSVLIGNSDSISE